MILISDGDYNLPTLAGICEVLCLGHILPIDLYVFGCRGAEEKMIYLDPDLENVEKIHAFLVSKGIPVTLNMPFNPLQRPAVALSRAMREDDSIDLAARVCVFVQFCMHETIQMGDLDELYP